MVVVTGDHTTPTTLGDHTYQPVPVAIASLRHILKDTPHNLRDNVTVFDEISCAEGLLGRFSGSQLMALLMKFRERVGGSD